MKKRIKQNTLDAKINKLALVVKKGFAQTNKRFDQTNKRFDQTDKRFDQTDKRFDQTNKRFDQTNKRFDHALDELAAMVAQGFAETVTKKEFDAFRSEMYDFRDKTNKRFFDLETRLIQVEINLAKLTERVDKFVHIFEAQQAENRELRALVVDLKGRVERLELGK